MPNVKDDTSVTTSVSGVAKVLVDTKTIASAGQATAKTMTLSGETATITLPQTDGTTTYYVRAVDGAGNLSDEKTPVSYTHLDVYKRQPITLLPMTS